MSGSSSARRPSEFGAMLVALAVTAATWQTLSRAATYLLVESEQPAVAIGLRPWDGHALRSLANAAVNHRNAQGTSSANVTAAKADLAAQLAKKALKTKPLDPMTLRVLAQSAELKSGSASAEKIMEVAGQQTIRDDAVNFYLLNLYASRKDYARALERADALLRISPSLTSNTLPLVDSIAVDPGAQPVLIALLRSGPPWRGAFLGDIASRLVKPEGFLDVILALKDGPHPLQDQELRAYLDPLIARGLVDQAYDTWLQLLPPKRLAALRYVDNGDFEYPPTNLPFDWMMTPIDGATISVDEIPDQDGRGLHILFDGKRVPFRNVVQMLKLPAGKYRLSGSYWSIALDNPRGMTWRIYCAQRNDSVPIVQTERVLGTSDGWKTFEASFEVPPNRCTAQWLRLELAARVAVEESISGGIWYDHIKVSKSEEDQAAPNAPGIRMPGQPGTQFERAIRGQ